MLALEYNTHNNNNMIQGSFKEIYNYLYINFWHEMLLSYMY